MKDEMKKKAMGNRSALVSVFDGETTDEKRRRSKRRRIKKEKKQKKEGTPAVGRPVVDSRAHNPGPHPGPRRRSHKSVVSRKRTAAAAARMSVRRW